MNKSIHSVFFTLGLIFLLVACGVSEASPPRAPVEPQETPATEIKPDPSNTAPSVEESVVQEEVVSEKEASAAEAIAPETEVVSEDVAAEEKVISDEVVAAHPGPTEEQQQLLASLPVVGEPPELYNEVWLNSEPLKLVDLRGKVVIVEFWTFG